MSDLDETTDVVAEDAAEEVKPAAPAGDAEGNKLYVGNLPFSIDNAKLGEAFSGIDGVEVVEAVVITDKFNEGRSKGFGFVTVGDAAQADKAIAAMNGQDLDGRKIVVNVARPKVERNDRDNDRRGGFNRSY
ncbi:MAG: RNA-binding protein [Candidatus Berkelbacteria bacterium]